MRQVVEQRRDGANLAVADAVLLDAIEGEERRIGPAEHAPDVRQILELARGAVLEVVLPDQCRGLAIEAASRIAVVGGYDLGDERAYAPTTRQP